MTILRNLFANRATNHFTWTTPAFGVEHGNNFIAPLTAALTELHWFRTAPGVGGPPDDLRVWDRVTGGQVVNVAVPADNNATGWQTTVLPNKIPLVPGRTYTVSGYWANGNGYPQYIGAMPQTVEYPLQLGNPQRSTGVANAPGYPNTTNDNVAVFGLDVTVEFADPDAEPPATGDDVEARLDAWLRTSPAPDELTGAPWLSYQLLLANQTALGVVDAALADLQDKFGTAFGPLGNLAIGALRTQLDQTKDTVDAIKAKIDASLTADTGDVPVRLTEIRDILANPVTPEPPAAPTAEWTITASDNETGPAIITEPADFYNITITGLGAANVVRPVAGQDLLNFAWWVAPLRGGAVGTYQTYRALSADVYEPGRRLPGLLVSVPADFEWTWEAWTYATP